MKQRLFTQRLGMEMLESAVQHESAVQIAILGHAVLFANTGTVLAINIGKL